MLLLWWGSRPPARALLPQAGGSETPQPPRQMQLWVPLTCCVSSPSVHRLRLPGVPGCPLQHGLPHDCLLGLRQQGAGGELAAGGQALLASPAAGGSSSPGEAESPFPVQLGPGCLLWSCCEDHQRSQECLSLTAPAARPGELRALPGAPLPCSLPAPGGQDRRDRDLLPISLEDAPGRAGCCSWYQGTGLALPCPFLVWGGLMVPPPGWGSWGKSSKRAGGLLNWLQALVSHWTGAGSWPIRA